MGSARRDAAAAERLRDRRFRAALLGVMIGTALLGAGVVLVASLREPRAEGYVLMAVGPAVAVAAGVLAWRWRPDEAAQRQSGVGRRDREQQARRRALLNTPLVLGLGLLVITPAVWRMINGSDSLADWLWAGCGVLYAWIAPAMVLGWDGGSRKQRKFLEDEFSQALRARAMTAGFVVLLAATSLVYLLGLWRPEAAVTAMPVALASGGLAAALRFALLDRAAEAGGDE